MVTGASFFFLPRTTSFAFPNFWLAPFISAVMNSCFGLSLVIQGFPGARALCSPTPSDIPVISKLVTSPKAPSAYTR